MGHAARINGARVTAGVVAHQSDQLVHPTLRWVPFIARPFVFPPLAFALGFPINLARGIALAWRATIADVQASRILAKRPRE